MVKAVIFDIDGTLIDSVDMHARAWQDTFLRYGIKTDFRVVREQIGKGGDKLMKVFLSEQQIRRWGKEIEGERTELFKRQYLPLVKPFPQVRGLFERLRHDGIKIALASSAKGDELRDYKKITGIASYLSAETSSDDVEHSKPDPDIFLAAQRRLGIDPRNIIAIGDTPYDAESAGKAGITTIGLLCGGWSPQKLRAAGCVALYRDAADLLKNYNTSPLATSGVERTIEGDSDGEKFMNSQRILYFLTGLGLGAAAGILYAPKSGRQTRDFLSSESEKGARYAKETASDAMRLVNEKAEKVGQTVAETINTATQNMERSTES